ncbi:MAG: hypothetical protein LQ344_006053 [Seirophora lacunosa]|nr:MAG: hypothetical protein LQ344_006053 [Seirophora lacunosa]
MDAFTHAMSFQKQSSTLVKMLCRDSSFLIAFLFATLSSFVLASPLPFANDGLAMTPAASANPAYPNISIIPLSRASSSTHWLDVTQPLMTETTIIFHVPGTPTRLILKVWNEELPRAAMSHAIIRTKEYAVSRLFNHRDGPLDARDDPFWLDSGNGVIFGLWSSDPTRRLTYRELESTATGLWLAMYMEDKFNAATISVYDRASPGQIGYGVLRLGHLRYPVADS